MPARDCGRLELEISEAKRRFDLSADTPVVSCYEAGRDGFWLHRFLSQAGVDNVVVDSSSIEVNRRARRAKTDALDLDGLMKLLIRHHLGEKKVWSVVRVPTIREEDARQLHREIRTVQKERTRTTNRIRGLLANQGIGLPPRFHLTEDTLRDLRLWDGAPLPPGLRARLTREGELLAFLRSRLKQLEAERRRALMDGREAGVEKARRLMRLKSIGPVSAYVLGREVFGWREFRNRRQVGAFVGLTPTPYQSGSSSREQGITKAGPRQVRALAIELAWIWLRHQPTSALAAWYEHRFANGGPRMRRVGIVALARRLMIDLWRYVEFGVIPEGAELKAA
jgi:transposase